MIYLVVLRHQREIELGKFGVILYIIWVDIHLLAHGCVQASIHTPELLLLRGLLLALITGIAVYSVSESLAPHELIRILIICISKQ